MHRDKKSMENEFFIGAASTVFCNHTLFKHSFIMNSFRKLPIFLTFLQISATKSFFINNCHLPNHIKHLPVQNSCKTTVINLLNSNSEHQDVEFCAYMESVCVSTAHDYFSKIKVSGVCDSFSMEIAVRKLKTCKNFVEIVGGASLGKHLRNFEKVKKKKATRARKCAGQLGFNPKYLRFSLCRF